MNRDTLTYNVLNGQSLGAVNGSITVFSRVSLAGLTILGYPRAWINPLNTGNGCIEYISSSISTSV